MQNFMELIWLLHVIACAVFFFFWVLRKKKSKFAFYYLNEFHAEFSGTNLVSACLCDVLI